MNNIERQFKRPLALPFVRVCSYLQNEVSIISLSLVVFAGSSLYILDIRASSRQVLKNIINLSLSFVRACSYIQNEVSIISLSLMVFAGRPL